VQHLQAGLNSILEPYFARGASQEEIQEVTARAEAFYLQSFVLCLCLKLESRTDLFSSRQQSAETPAAPPATAASAPAPSSDAPPYPLSFAALAALIASGAPIPGIKDIPDKLAEGAPSESKVDVGRIRKPWEKAPESGGSVVGDGVKEAAAEEGSRQV